MCNRRILSSAFKLLVSMLFAVVAATQAGAESAGQQDFDDAMRMRVTAQGLPDLTNVIDSLQMALDKGLEVEDAEMAEGMLSAALMERATALMQVVNSQSIGDERIKQILRLIISDLRRVLAYDNPPPQANLMLGKLMSLPGGDPHEARRVLTTFIETDGVDTSERAEAYILRARVQPDEQKALADFDAAIALVPENTNFGLIRAMYLRSKEKLDDALVSIDKMIDDSPQDANALILQGEILRDLGKPDEALKSFDEATKLAPQASGPYQHRGEIYREKQEFEKAIEQFTKVVELQPGDFQPLVYRAESYLHAGKLNEALADVDTVLEKQKLVAAQRLRGEILAQLDRLDEAIAEMQQLTRAVPNQPELKLQLALYYLINKQPREAISEYDDVLLLNPDHFLALRSRADAYLNIGKHEEAIADFEKALKIEPEDTAILNNLAWVLATSPDAELRDGKRAVELATKACELTDYKLPHILSTLAAAFAESGNFDTAIEWSQKAVEMDDPVNAEQLAKELESYQKKEPWRERQDVGQTEGTPKSGSSSGNLSDEIERSLDF